MASAAGVWGDLRDELAKPASQLVDASAICRPRRARWLEGHFRRRSSRCSRRWRSIRRIRSRSSRTGARPDLRAEPPVATRSRLRELVLIPPSMPRFVRLPGEAARFIAARGDDRASSSRCCSPGFAGRRRGRFPGAARQRHRDRGGGRGPRPLLPERAQAPPPRPGDPARARREHARRARARCCASSSAAATGDRHRDRRHARHRRLGK